MRDKEGWGETLFAVVVVAAMVAFMWWLLALMLSIAWEFAWMTVR